MMNPGMIIKYRLRALEYGRRVDEVRWSSSSNPDSTVSQRCSSLFSPDLMTRHQFR